MKTNMTNTGNKKIPILKKIPKLPIPVISKYTADILKGIK